MGEDEKNFLKDELHKGIVLVEFTKKDGTNRVMKCTLNEELIPSEFTPKGVGKAKNDSILSVFDVEVNGWRSFGYESIIAVLYF